MTKRNQTRTRKPARRPSRQAQCASSCSAPVFDGVTPLEPRLLLSADTGGFFSSISYNNPTLYGRAEGWQVYVDLDQNGQLDEGEPVQITDQVGQFVFRDMAKGDYTVRVVEREGFKIDHNAQAVRVKPGFVVEPGNIIFITPTDPSALPEGHGLKTPVMRGSLAIPSPGPGATDYLLTGWRVYVDTNENGTLDEGEQSILTDGMGQYTFFDLPEGEYSIGVVLQEGYTASETPPRQSVVTGNTALPYGKLYVFQPETASPDSGPSGEETQPDDPSDTPQQVDGTGESTTPPPLNPFQIPFADILTFNPMTGKYEIDRSKLTSSPEGDLQTRPPLETEKIPDRRTAEEIQSLIKNLTVTNVGSVTTEGDTFLNADDARSIFSVNGSNIKVGVISDGAGGLAARIADGDLPEDVLVNESLPGSGVEGTAMMEIIYDLAPNVELYFSSGDNMIESITWLVGQNVDIIVDDVSVYTEPFFELGSLAEHVQDTIDSGITYITAAGNSAEKHYQAQYDAYVDLGTGYVLHDFDASPGVDLYNEVVIPSGKELTAVVQWSDPYGGSSNDYDLLLYNSSKTSLLAVSSFVQNGTQNPIEFLGYQNNTGSPITVNLAIRLYSGSAAREIELYSLGYGVTLEYVTTDDSIVGHQLVEDAIVVGAVDSSGLSRDYSSRGQATIYTDFSAQTKSFIDVLDVMALDGVSTATYGSLSFPGTSAAAPHVAGIAALWLSVKPNMTPDRVNEVLYNTATDLGSAGYDSTYGIGKADAFPIFRSFLPTLADFNDDTHPDMAWRDYTNGLNVVWLLEDGVKNSSGSFNTVADTNWRLEGFGDFDRNGDIDLFWHNSSTLANIVWFMDGTIKQSSESITAAPSGWEVEAIADVNLDGFVDLVWRNYSTGTDQGKNVVWYMGDSGSTNHGTYKTGSANLDTVADTNWKLAGAADSDADGDMDLYWRNTSDSTLIVWLMSQTTKDSSYGISSSGSSGYSLERIDDLDRDGFPDLVWFDTSSNQAKWWRMMNSTVDSVANIGGPVTGYEIAG